MKYLCAGVWLLMTLGAWATPLRVVCTTPMVADLVKNVAGARAAVTSLVGEGVDPHLYKPTRDDVAKMLAADVIFYNGLMLEGRMEETFKKLAAKGKPVRAVTSTLPEEKLLAQDGHADPHVWMDPALWAECIGVVRETLTSEDAEGAGDFAANAGRYAAELQALDAYVKRVIATIPEEKRVLVTAHDAFQYFSRATGLQVMGIQGISTESEAGVADINRLVDEVVQRKIPAIFVESSVPDKNVRAVIEGAGARGAKLANGGELFSDSMGKAGTYEGTYIGMLDHNATTIARGLGGEAPARGMSGRLSP